MSSGNLVKVNTSVSVLHDVNDSLLQIIYDLSEQTNIFFNRQKKIIGVLLSR